MSVVVRTAAFEDAAALAPRLREADAREIAASVGGDPATVLAAGIARSDPSLAVVEDAVVIGLFGVLPDADQPGSGMVWLVGAEAVVRPASRFVRASRRWLADLQDRYAVLWTRVDVRNEAHVRWLRAAGFTFLRIAEHHGVEGRPFHEVARARSAPGDPIGEHDSGAAGR